MDVIWILFLAALGACVGSFLNVVVYRMPRGESIAFPGSHCFSWLILRARCRNCKVKISPRYIIVEAVTAALVVGLYLAYYVFDVRKGAGTFPETWPMFAAHAGLLCGLLACSLVDIEHWIVPLEVCWFLSLAGAVLAAVGAPHPFMPAASPGAGALAVGAGLGLVVALLLQRYGVLQQSFLDAEDKPPLKAQPAPDAPKNELRKEDCLLSRPALPHCQFRGQQESDDQPVVRIQEVLLQLLLG